MHCIAIGYKDDSLFFLQDTLLLDIYLAPHVTTLYTQIRNRALCQVCYILGIPSSIRIFWFAGTLKKISFTIGSYVVHFIQSRKSIFEPDIFALWCLELVC